MARDRHYMVIDFGERLMFPRDHGASEIQTQPCKADGNPETHLRNGTHYNGHDVSAGVQSKEIGSGSHLTSSAVDCAAFAIVFLPAMYHPPSRNSKPA